MEKIVFQDPKLFSALVSEDEIGLVVRLSFEVERSVDALLLDALEFDAEGVSFASKCLMIRAMQVPQSLLRGVDVVRHVRNKFAHDPTASLQKYASMLEPLFAERFTLTLPVSGMRLTFSGFGEIEDKLAKEGIDVNGEFHFDDATISGKFWFLGLAIAACLRDLPNTHSFWPPTEKLIGAK